MDVHDSVMQDMQEMAEKFASQGIALQMPPPSGKILNTRYVAVDPGKSLTAEFAFDARFANPIGTFQGGFLCGAFDEVFGPLTYMAAKRPAVAVDISTTFIRPFSPRTGTLTITAEVVSRGAALLVLRAEARSQDGKLVATAASHAMITADRHLNTARQNEASAAIA
jgi:uncharacterized protein (TIGR00369 family)